MKTLKQTYVFVMLALSLLGCTGDASTPAAQAAALSDDALLARGKYLVTIAGCHDCHSPKVMTERGPEPDPERLLSGHPADEQLPPLDSADRRWLSMNQGFTGFVGPWGVSFAANLSPDVTGTGSWSFEQFKTAIRAGKYKGLEGSRDLLPPMPWQMYRHFTDEDLKAIFSFIRSLKPVRNLVPAPIAPPAQAAPS